ncbi:hypothetical protein K458DRAFT_480005 [Lentithecium fluviatile CBS 122367]|uniref:F-box domain-containing protein n=1 Tax=Lentithecium fluviatile CBS 122367 TaxID=1168545 RepID=A0A6G1IQ02_9PLEO|nr:hypothetical protein K458DRAFT_480005 [Lentithecium fluviatile CBS 122367]
MGDSETTQDGTMPAISDDSASEFVGLAPELLELILSYLKPHDLISFARTCHRANEFIRPNNQILWKAAFLHIFDHPKHAWGYMIPTARAANRSRESAWDWYRELRRRCAAFHAVCDLTLLTDVENVVTALLNVNDTASYTNTDEVGTKVSLNLNFLERLQQQTPNFDRVVHDYQHNIESMSLPMEPMAEHDRPITRSMVGGKVAVPEWASRFHIIYGPTRREEDSIRAKAAARALVYDWSVTGSAVEYGPFHNDTTGTVNWQVVEAISSLMHRILDTTLKMYRLRHSGFAVNIPQSLPRFSISEDWAGVTGIWVGTYAFLDYRALVHYNFAHTQAYPLDLGHYEEACGDLMRLVLAVDDSEDLKQDLRFRTNLPRYEDLPVLFFSGWSGSPTTGRPSIGVRGSVCLVPGGREVRWRFIISYAGADQWQLEGVQPGIRSGAIYGLWSHVEHDENGPTGPFYYCPLELCERSYNW